MGQTLDPQTLKRIIEATRYYEQQYRNATPQAAGPSLTVGRWLAYTTSLIRARTGTGPNFTLGSGTAKLLKVINGVTSDAGYGDVTVLSGATGTNTIASGKLIIVLEINGAYHVLTDYC